MAPTKVAAASLKRKEATKPAPAAKKAKREAWANISDAISTANISDETKTLLLAVLPLTLGEFADDRHKFQEQMVQAIEDVLRDIEAGLVAEVSRVQSEQTEMEGKKTSLEGTAAEAASSLDAKKAEVQGLKRRLAADALAFRSAKKAVQDAEEEKNKQEFELNASRKKQDEYNTMLGQLDFLKDALPEESDAQAKGAALLALVQKHAFEDSMLIALPSALRKSPDSRGQFDKLTIDGLQIELNKRIAFLDVAIGSFAPIEKENAAAMEKARETLNVSNQKLRDSAKAFQTADAEQEMCTGVAADALKTARDMASNLKRTIKVCDSSEAELEVFRAGPLETFQSLRNIAKPKPEVAQVDEELVESVGHAVEEVPPPVVAC